MKLDHIFVVHLGVIGKEEFSVGTAAASASLHAPDLISVQRTLTTCITHKRRAAVPSHRGTHIGNIQCLEVSLVLIKGVKSCDGLPD